MLLWKATFSLELLYSFQTVEIELLIIFRRGESVRTVFPKMVREDTRSQITLHKFRLSSVVLPSLI